MNSDPDPRPTETVHPHEAGPGALAGIELLAPGTELAGRFEIRRPLGAGGFAHVYLAWDRTLRREVAIKVLRSDRLAPTTLRRFRREAAVARDAAHPNVVRVFEIFESGVYVFLTLEAVRGGTVRDRIADGPLPIDEALRIAREAFAGLAELHRLGTLHRDVKPSNLLLAEDGTVKVSDFGLALNLGADETRATQHTGLLGTLEYLSPEQALGDDLDARSDLYSMGVVLYEMLTGELPHGARSSIGSLLERLRTVRPPDVRAKRPDVPRWLAELVDRLLEVRPERRYRSALAVLADLDAATGPPPRWSRRIRERWPWIAAATVAACAAVWSVAEYRDSRFDSVSLIGSSRIRAVARDGRTLWERTGGRAAGQYLPFRDRDGRTAIAAVPPTEGEYIRSSDAELHVIEPQSGTVLRRIPLPPADRLPAGFADSFTANLSVHDLDGHPPDEIVVTFLHSPYYPCYAVLVEPALDRTRTILVASGHHRYVGAVDLDDDGRSEILMLGTNNRLGWLNGLAAIRVEPPIGEGRASRYDPAPAYTPELRGGSLTRDPLLWYTLLPPSHLSLADQPLRIDERNRRLEVSLGSVRQPIALGFDGFPLADAPGLADAAVRRDARMVAQERLAEAMRLFRAESIDSALPLFESGARLAAEAGDPYLEWILELHRARSLVRTGELETASSAFEALWSRGLIRAEVAFQAGLELFAAGRRSVAIDWLKRALEADASYLGGRTKQELFRSLLLALAATGRFDDADLELERYGSAMPEQGLASEALLLAVLTRRAPPPAPPRHPADPELTRFARLEARVRNGDPAAGIREELRGSRADGVGPPLLYDVAESALLEREGRHAEALALARSAADEARAIGGRDLLVAAILPYVEERISRLENPSHRSVPDATGNR